MPTAESSVSPDEPSAPHAEAMAIACELVQLSARLVVATEAWRAIVEAVQSNPEGSAALYSWLDSEASELEALSKRLDRAMPWRAEFLKVLAAGLH